jgi:hypothetical protein
MLFNTIVNMMKVLLAHQTLGVGNIINVNMIRVWHKIIKFWVNNNEGIACTLNSWYWNENNVQHDESIAHNDEGCDDKDESISYTPMAKNIGVWR